MRKSLQPGFKRFQRRKGGREGRQTTKENTDKLDLKLKTSAHQIVPSTKEKGNLWTRRKCLTRICTQIYKKLYN